MISARVGAPKKLTWKNFLDLENRSFECVTFSQIFDIPLLNNLFISFVNLFVSLIELKTTQV